MALFAAKNRQDDNIEVNIKKKKQKNKSNLWRKV